MGKPRTKRHFENIVVDGRIILDSVLKNRSSVRGRDNVLQGRDEKQAVVDTVMNLSPVQW
jgi:hypothetical protein